MPTLCSDAVPHETQAHTDAFDGRYGHVGRLGNLTIKQAAGMGGLNQLNLLS